MSERQMTAMQASDQFHGVPLDRGLLRQGVDQANIPALLSCLVQLTGNQAWLEEPFAPRDRKSVV